MKPYMEQWDSGKWQDIAKTGLSAAIIFLAGILFFLQLGRIIGPGPAADPNGPSLKSPLPIHANAIAPVRETQVGRRNRSFGRP